METKTVTVPNISCGHCVMTIEREVGEVEGVASVKGEKETKRVDRSPGIPTPPTGWSSRTP